MDDIIENCQQYVERGFQRPANVTHEFDVKFDNWATQNERLRKSTGTECNQHFRRVLDNLSTINLEVTDPFVSIVTPFNARYQFKVAGQNHNERLQTLSHLKARLPHNQSLGSLKSIDDYKSLTKRDLFDLIHHDVESNRCEVQSVMSTTSTIFTNKKVFSRALQSLRMLQIEDSGDEDDFDDDFEKNIIASNAAANVPPKNSILCIPSGHEDDLDAFKKVNQNSKNRFVRNQFNYSVNKQQDNRQKQQIKK